MRTDREENSLKIFIEHLFDVTLALNMTVQLNINAVIEDILNVTVYNFGWQPVFGDTNSHHSTENTVFFENGNGVAHLPKVERCGQTGWSGADNCDLLAVFFNRCLFLLRSELLAVFVIPVRQEPLYISD